MNTQLKLIAGIFGGVLLVGIIMWLLFFRAPSTAPDIATPIGFGIGDDRTVVIPAAEEENTPISSSQGQQKVFQVADGPITSATLVQTLQPTTTIARYILQENGHVMDLVLDTAGAIPRAVSNTTIPGSVQAQWVEKGAGAILQYLDDAVIKTLYLGLPPATATTTKLTRIQFLPDNITSFAASPSGTSVSYLLSSASGVDGYIAKADGSGSTKLFTLPLRDLLLSWPAESTLLAQMKSAANTSGVVFSIAASNGNVVPLLIAEGVTATANPNFSRVIYQTISTGRAPTTYTRNMITGEDGGLSFDPIPEKCVWGAATTTMYCATPTQYVPPDYLGLWHQSAASLVDTIVAYNIETNKSDILATPGSNEGGVESDVAEMSVSPDGRYLLFIKKGERSLWAARLVQ